MLADTIRSRMIEAMKAKDNPTRDILKIALGEIQTLQARNLNATEEECIKVVRKITESNNETMKIMVDKDENAASSDLFKKLVVENAILNNILPSVWDKDTTASYINKNMGKIVLEAKSDGEAIKMVMQYIKQQQLPVNGKYVSEIVKEMRIVKQGE